MLFFGSFQKHLLICQVCVSRNYQRPNDATDLDDIFVMKPQQILLYQFRFYWIWSIVMTILFTNRTALTWTLYVVGQIDICRSDFITALKYANMTAC